MEEVVHMNPASDGDFGAVRGKVILSGLAVSTVFREMTPDEVAAMEREVKRCGDELTRLYSLFGVPPRVVRGY